MPNARAAAMLSALSSTNIASSGVMPMRVARELVDRPLGFAHADVARVDDVFAQLVDREHRAPVVAELLHVVREQPDAQAARPSARASCARPSSARPARSCARSGRTRPCRAAVPSTAGAFSTMRSKYVATSSWPFSSRCQSGSSVDLRLDRVGRATASGSSAATAVGDRATLDADVVRLAEQQLRAANPSG